MDQASTLAFTQDVKDTIFSALHLQESQLDDLGGFESFIYLNPQADSVVRLTLNVDPYGP